MSPACLSRFVDNWNLNYTKKTYSSKVPYQLGKSYQNHFAVSILFALYFPLLFIQILRNTFRPTPERMRSPAFNVWQILSSIAPFVALIIGAHVAWSIKHTEYEPGSNENYYQVQLKVTYSYFTRT